MDKLIIRSETDAIVGFRLPNGRRVNFPRRGVTQRVDIEEFKDAFWQPGVDYLFIQGLLSFDNMELKKELGLEEENAEVPVKTVVLSLEDLKFLTQEAKFSEFEERLKNLSSEQIKGIASYVITNGIDNVAKAQLLQKLTTIDVLRAHQLNKE